MTYHDRTPRKSQKSDPVGEVGIRPSEGIDGAGALDQWHLGAMVKIGLANIVYNIKRTEWLIRNAEAPAI